MSRQTMTMSTAATGTATLPASYREALNQLTTESESTASSHPSLSSLSDKEVLTLAKEVLSNFYARKDEWASGDGADWARKETELLRLSGSAAEFNMVATPFTLASAVGDYLCTFVDALEYKLGEKTKQPELMSKKRNVVVDGCEDTEVFGPVAISPLYSGNTFEVWTTPADETKEATDSDKIGQVAVVLGAGNQSMLTIIDVLDNTFRNRRVCLVKHHPLRPWLEAPYGIILEPLTQRGYFAQLPDISTDATKALLSDPAVGHVHITGAFKTSQAVHETLQKAHPELSTDNIESMITSELGCATPQILDDGVYTDLEIQHVCQIIAFGKKTNGGCNCLSAQVIVLPKQWAQKDIFRTKLLAELKRQPTTPCYYPGSVERKASMIEKCQQSGSKCTTVVAASVSDETKISDADQVVVVECGTPGEEGYNPEPLITEAFGPLLAIVELDIGDGGDDDYLAKTAVPFLNNKDNIFGSLSCAIFTPDSKGKVSDRKGLQSALAALQYGGISLNQANMFGYFTGVKGGKWGSHPLETLHQSGNGLVGDQYGIIGNKNAKTIVYGPSLEKKPIFDLANNPPSIVFAVMIEFATSPSALRGVLKALKVVITKSVYGIVSSVPGIGRFF